MHDRLDAVEGVELGFAGVEVSAGAGFVAKAEADGGGVGEGEDVGVLGAGFVDAGGEGCEEFEAALVV